MSTLFRQDSVLMILVVALGMGCRTTGLRGGDAPEAPVRVFVAEGGNDSGDGSEKNPFGTLERALSVPNVGEVVIAQGVYRASIVRVRQPVRLNGRGATILGHLEIQARVEIEANGSGEVEPIHLERSGAERSGAERSNAARSDADRSGAVPGDAERGGVEIFGLDIRDGVSIVGDRRHVRIASSTVAAGRHENALSIVDSGDVRVEDVVVECGDETCIDARTSTMTASRVRFVPRQGTKRGARFAASHVTLERLQLRESAIAQLLAEQRSSLEIHDALLEDAKGSGLVAVGGSRLVLERTAILRARNAALLLQDAQARLIHAQLSSEKGPTVGVTGGETNISRSSITASPSSALSVSRRDGTGLVTIDGGEIRHGRYVGVSIASGDVRINGTKFFGDPSAESDGGEAVLAHGLDAHVEIVASFDAPTSFAVSLSQDASGTVAGVVTRPRLGGVLIDSVTTETVKIAHLEVRDCALGSGVVVMESTGILVEKLDVSRCAEAGLLAGNESEVSVNESRFFGNQRYGLAAFGGSTLRVGGTHASGSTWATFATCSDGAGITDLGGNHFDGATNDCP